MLNKQTHTLLALFADGIPHSFFETAKLGSIALKLPERKLEKLFKRTMLANCWVRRCWRSWNEQLDFYELTEKGDQCFRSSQIWRITRGKNNEEAVRHFKMFNRKVEGKYGVEGMGEKISEEDAHLRETHPELYTPKTF